MIEHLANISTNETKENSFLKIKNKNGREKKEGILNSKCSCLAEDSLEPSSMTSLLIRYFQESLDATLWCADTRITLKSTLFNG